MLSSTEFKEHVIDALIDTEDVREMLNILSLDIENMIDIWLNDTEEYGSLAHNDYKKYVAMCGQIPEGMEMPNIDKQFIDRVAVNILSAAFITKLDGRTYSDMTHEDMRFFRETIESYLEEARKRSVNNDVYKLIDSFNNKIEQLMEDTYDGE